MSLRNYYVGHRDSQILMIKMVTQVDQRGSGLDLIAAGIYDKYSVDLFDQCVPDDVLQ